LYVQFFFFFLFCAFSIFRHSSPFLIFRGITRLGLECNVGCNPSCGIQSLPLCMIIKVICITLECPSLARKNYQYNIIFQRRQCWLFPLISAKQASVKALMATFYLV
jgi:hypothetical protein